MAKKQRVRQGQAHSIDVVLVMVVCALVACAGVGYVWQKQQIYKLGQQIKLHENRLEVLHGENARLRRSYAALCIPRELEARVRDMKLGLTVPQPDQIVRLPDGPAEHGKTAQLYTAR